MKKTFLLMLCSLLMGAAVIKGQDRVMVIADPHVLPQSVIAQDANFDVKNAKEVKMFHLSEAIWNALIDTAIAYHPSLVLIPGDLTREGEPASHDTVVAGLRRLQQAGIPSLIVPGNHDYPEKYDWDSLYAVSYANVKRHAGSYSYSASPLQGVTVIGFDGTNNGRGGQDSILPATLQFVLAQADSAKALGHTVIAMTHWQVLEHFDKQTKVESASRYKNADAVRDSLMAHGVHLILTGHFHVNSITTWRDSTGVTKDSIVEISTGSPITYPCAYRWMTISADRADIAVTTGFITKVDTVADLMSYSRAWAREHTYNQISILAPRLWKKVDSYKEKIVNEYSLIVKLMCSFYGDLAAEMDNAFPKTSAEQTALVQRHLGNTIVNLYQFHSEANENEHPEVAQALVDSMNAGMQSMMLEVVENSEVLSCLSDIIVPLAKVIAAEPVQSMVEDRTRIGKKNEDRTDDLHLTLHVNAPQTFTGIESIPAEEQPYQKFLQNGQFYIRRGNLIYNANGQRVE